MGRKYTRDETMGTEAACEALGIKLRELRSWQREGLLQAVVEEEETLFLRVDVLRLAVVKQETAPSARTAWVIALQALSAVKVLEARLSQLMDNLGMSAPPLDRSSDGIWELGTKMVQAPRDAELAAPDWVRFWAGTFFGMDENYLELVAQETGETEPWRPYVDFVNGVLRGLADPTRFERDFDGQLRHAYRYLEGAARHLTYVGYLFCRHRFGAGEARHAFGDRPTIVDEVVAALG